MATEFDKKQAEREALEKSLLNQVNALPIPDSYLKNIRFEIDGPKDTSDIVKNYLGNTQIVDVVDNILTNTEDKKQEMLAWLVVPKIDPAEKERRTRLVHGLTYRYLVLKNIYNFFTGKIWQPESVSPLSIVGQIDIARQKMKIMKFEDDYTDQVPTTT